MPTVLWRSFALAGALAALIFVMVDTVDIGAYTDDHVATTQADGHTYAHLRVIGVTGSPAEHGGLQRGDIIAPAQPRTMRERLGGAPAGSTQRWTVVRGTSHFTTVTTTAAASPDELLLVEIFNVVRIAMILVALVVALRRPEVPAARALVTFLITMALTLLSSGTWLPDQAFLAWNLIREPIQAFSLSQGLQFACIFPYSSERGPRAWLRRLNPWFTLAVTGVVFGLNAWNRLANGLPDLGPVAVLVDWSPMLYFIGIAAAFFIAAVRSTGSDRRRVYWAAGSICFGFSGPILATVLYNGAERADAWVEYLALTLVAMPLGLAYTILRHRTVDIGFVISRALVLTVLSAVIVIAFGLLERALGKIFIDASHIASRSVEIALALGLGFSLRSLHAQIERVIDRIFFRDRHRALGALKSFADEVYFITDPDIAIERTVEVVNRCADAPNTAIYLLANGVFSCAAAIDPAAWPPEVSENDPLFVRLRASRQAELAGDVDGAIVAEIAFPMFVRAMLVGALVLTGKRTGEAYDPDEKALLSELTQRVALALDALQTLALRRELESLVRTPGATASV